MAGNCENCGGTSYLVLEGLNVIGRYPHCNGSLTADHETGDSEPAGRETGGRESANCYC